MTYAEITLGRPRLLDIVLAPFYALGRGLIWLAENNSRMAELDKLIATSDEELAAKGLNRTDEVRRIFASVGAL